MTTGYKKCELMLMKRATTSV